VAAFVAYIGTTYDTELEVYADGYRLKLVDPYNAPVLYVRQPGVDHEGTRLKLAELCFWLLKSHGFTVSSEVHRFEEVIELCSYFS
jgi:hypothetical protein